MARSAKASNLRVQAGMISEGLFNIILNDIKQKASYNGLNIMMLSQAERKHMADETSIFVCKVVRTLFPGIDVPPESVEFVDWSSFWE